MTVVTADPAPSDRAAEMLYAEALALADETRAYYDTAGRAACAALDPSARVRFACEGLKATTRLMHVTAWLATRRPPAMAAGDQAVGAAGLADSVGSAPAVLGGLPTPARQLILAGIDLHGRAQRLAAGMDGAVSMAGPQQAMVQRLQRAF
jgi:regulator of CtrA degradation